MHIRADRWWKHNTQSMGLCRENTCRAHRKNLLPCRKSCKVLAAVGRKCSCYLALDSYRSVKFERCRHRQRFLLSHCRKRARSYSTGRSSRHLRTRAYPFPFWRKQGPSPDHQFLATIRTSFPLSRSRSASTFYCFFDHFCLGSYPCIYYCFSSSLPNTRSKRASPSYHRTSSSENVCILQSSGIVRMTLWISCKWRDMGAPPFGSRNGLHRNRSGCDMIHRRFFRHIFWPRLQRFWPRISWICTV